MSLRYVLAAGALLAASVGTGTAAETALLGEHETALCVGSPSNMVGWWPLDETSGTTAFDLVGDNRGVHFGAPIPDVAAVGHGLTFDGVDDYVEIADDSLIDFADDDLSFTAWIRAHPRPGVRTILDKRVFTFLSGYHVFLFDNRLGIQLADGKSTNYISDLQVADGNLHHVAITVNRSSPPQLVGNIGFYLDGQALDIAGPTGPIGYLGNSAPLRIGARSGVPSGFWDGVIDEVALYRRVLEPSEIKDLAAAGDAGTCKCARLSCQPVAWWTFDRRQDEIAQDSAGHFSGPHPLRIQGATRLFGRVGNALFFDGVDDAAVVMGGELGEFDHSRPGALTLKAWIRTSQPNGPVISALRENNFDLPVGWYLGLYQGLPHFFISPVSGIVGGCSAPLCAGLDLADDRWHLLGATATWDAGGENLVVRLYADGTLIQTSGPGQLSEGISARPVELGASLTRIASFFRGSIDEPQVFAHALTEADFASIYAAGSAGECQPSVAPQVCAIPFAENCPAGHYCDYLAASDCGRSPLGGLCRPRPEFCPLHEDPVCGCDGSTYSNACFANHFGVSVVSEGPCP